MAYRPSRQDSALSGNTLYQDNYGADRPSAKLPANDSFASDYGREQTGYRDEPQYERALPRPPFAQENSQRVSFAPPKSTGDLRIWRHDERGNMWTKGSRGRCVGRFFCCTVLMTLLLIVSIALSLALWARPPNIAFNGIQLPTNSSAVSVQTNSLDIFLSISIGVRNPNYFGAIFKNIEAQAFYPPLTQQLGGGSLSNLVIPSNSDTQFLFPFDINYSTSLDPQNLLVQDLVNKCGIKPGSTKQPLTVKYVLKLALRIAGLITISPSFSGTANFDCPVTRDDLLTLGGPDLLKSLGVD